MHGFNSWLEEKRKKATREPSPTTPTSAPLRGQNQDYSGVGVTHDHAAYTISDEYVNEISAELVGKVNKARTIDGKKPKTDAARQTLAKAVNKAWVKSKAGAVKESQIDEVIAGVGAVRGKPVTMMTTATPKSKNAPASASVMQHAADARRIQLDKLAQKQAELQKKTKVKEIKRRKVELERQK